MQPLMKDPRTQAENARPAPLEPDGGAPLMKQNWIVRNSSTRRRYRIGSRRRCIPQASPIRGQSMPTRCGILTSAFSYGRDWNLTNCSGS